MEDTTFTDFIVRLEDVKLPDDVKTRIAGKINAAVLAELATIDFGAQVVARIPHKEWLGIWLHRHASGDPIPARVPPLQVVSTRTAGA